VLTSLLAGIGLCFSLIAVPGAQNVFLLREGIRRAGERRGAMIALAVACLASDVVLISAGVAGFGVVMESAPWVFGAAKWAGVVFLAGYGLFAAWRAIRGTGEAIDATGADAIGAGGVAPLDDRMGGGEGSYGVGSSGTGSSMTVSSVSDSSVTGSSVTGPSGTATATIPIVHQRALPTARRAIMPAVLTCLAITWLNPHTYLDTVLLLGSVSTSYGDARWGFAIGAMIGSAAWFAFLTVAARFAARWLRSPRSWRILDGAVAVIMFAMAVAIAL